MTDKQKKSIILVSKYVVIYKDDANKFSIMRNYLHDKITRIFEDKTQSKNQSFGPS